MPITLFTNKTTNTATPAISVIPGNHYAFDLSGTFDSASCSLQQTVDGTNYRDDAGFTAMTAAGIQTFTATGNSITLTLTGGGASLSVTGLLQDLGGIQSIVRPDFSRENLQTVVTNS